MPGPWKEGLKDFLDGAEQIQLLGKKLSGPWKEGLRDLLDGAEQMLLLISTMEHRLNGSYGLARIKSIWTCLILSF